MIEEMNFSLLAKKETTELQVQLEGRANSLYKRLESRISKMQNNGFRSDESTSHGMFIERRLQSYAGITGKISIAIAMWD